MAAAAGLSRTTYRTGFDVSLPTFSVVQEIAVDRPTLISKERKHLLTLPQVQVEPGQRRILSELYSDHSNEFVRLKSCAKDGFDKRCVLDGASETEASFVFQSATYQ